MDAYILQISDILGATSSWSIAASQILFKFRDLRVIADISRENPPSIAVYAKQIGEHGITLTPVQLRERLTLSSDVIEYGQQMIRDRKHQNR